MARNTAFERFVAEKKKNPAFAEAYERAGVEIRAVDDLIRAVDAARIELGMTKADLARKVSATPEAMRRLLTADDVNPTFNTVLHVLEAVGLRFTVTAASPAAPAESPFKRYPKNANLKAAARATSRVSARHGRARKIA